MSEQTEGLIQKIRDRKDLRRMHGVLSSYGWSHNGKTSRYKHVSQKGTIALHLHSHGGAAWHHSGIDSARGVKSLIDHLAKLHKVSEMTASAAAGLQSSTNDPNWDDDKTVLQPPAQMADDPGPNSDGGGVPESVEDLHRVMQLHYFAHVGTHTKANEKLIAYSRIHAKDGSVERVNVTMVPGNVERWEHRHYGEIKKGRDSDSLNNFLKGIKNATN